MANTERKQTSSEVVEDVDVFDLDRIRRLVELMKEHGLNELDLRQARQQIRLSRGVPTAAPAMVTQAAAPPAVAAAAADSGAASGGAAKAEAEDEANIAYIRSPMVGTFYSRPNPNAAAYVNVGDHVQDETTVCIVEAMKVFNEIPAEMRGKIVAVLVNDEEPVDFGRPLYKVDTSS
jgi:acetyl-CoA carboxylase biotin carboxyl carrier protein